MRIVFMGTPEYSVKTLEGLIEDGHEIAAVFAQPDKPVGRKQILTPPAVKVSAEKHGIKVYQPLTFKDGAATKILQEIAPDVIVVVAYGKILPEEVLKIPKYGCVNGHASILPAYRGASPIQWCIVCGEKQTGVTAMLMDKGMDTGDILACQTTEIGDDETAEELFERLSVITASLLKKTVCDLEKGVITPVKQDETKATYAPIIKKEMAFIDFKEFTASEVHNKVRGYYSWPCAYYIHGGKRVKILKSKISGDTKRPAGMVIKSDEKFIIACKDGGSIELLTVQPEGSKPMSAKQMLCGRAVAEGTVIGD